MSLEDTASDGFSEHVARLERRFDELHGNALSLADLLTDQTGTDAGHFSRTVPQRSYSIADSIDGYPVHQATSAGAA